MKKGVADDAVGQRLRLNAPRAASGGDRSPRKHGVAAEARRAWLGLSVVAARRKAKVAGDAVEHRLRLDAPGSASGAVAPRGKVAGGAVGQRPRLDAPGPASWAAARRRRGKLAGGTIGSNRGLEWIAKLCNPDPPRFQIKLEPTWVAKIRARPGFPAQGQLLGLRRLPGREWKPYQAGFH